MFDPTRILADQQWGEFAFDNLRRLALDRGGTFAVHRFADRSVVGVDARHQCVLLRHAVDAAAKVARQRDAERNDLDLGDLETGRGSNVVGFVQGNRHRSCSLSCPLGRAQPNGDHSG
jgi:hypothetical protein